MVPTPEINLHDPMAQAVSDIHRHADEMIGFGVLAALCAGLAGWGVLWSWWPLAAIGAIATLVMLFAFSDGRRARERAAVRRETIISRELRYRGGRIAERPHGFAVMERA
jgi:hypothetical protein